MWEWRLFSTDDLLRHFPNLDWSKKETRDDLYHVMQDHSMGIKIRDHRGKKPAFEIKTLAEVQKGCEYWEKPLKWDLEQEYQLDEVAKQFSQIPFLAKVDDIFAEEKQVLTHKERIQPMSREIFPDSGSKKSTIEFAIIKIKELTYQSICIEGKNLKEIILLGKEMLTLLVSSSANHTEKLQGYPEFLFQFLE